MPFSFRKRIPTGDRTHLNVSSSGVSESIKLSDRVTFNTRQGLTIRLGKGFTFRTGKLF